MECLLCSRCTNDEVCYIPNRQRHPMGPHLEAVLLHKQNVTPGIARGHLTQGTLMGGTQKYLETFLIVVTEEGVVLLASSRWRPGMLLTMGSPPGSPVHGILQARILEWVAISSSRGCSPPRGQTHVSCISKQILYHLSQQGSPFISTTGSTTLSALIALWSSSL